MTFFFFTIFSRTNPADQLCFISGNNVILLDEHSSIPPSIASSSSTLPSTPTKPSISTPATSSIPSSRSSLHISYNEETSVEESKSAALESHEKYSRTKVVDEIIKRVIDPILVQIPSALRFKGLMLLGPPGVGKTYSLRVVKELTKSQCQVSAGCDLL